MAKISDKVMDAIADSLSTKACLLIFCIIAFVPLAVQIPKDILGWQQWVSQTAIQLIALSILAIVAKKEGREQRAMLKETHDTVMEQFKYMREDRSTEAEERQNIKDIVEDVHCLLKNKHRGRRKP